MHNDVNAFQCAPQSRFVTNIPNEIPQPRVPAWWENLRHLELFQLIARVHHKTSDVRVTRQYGVDEGFAKRACSAGDKNGLVVEHEGKSKKRVVIISHSHSHSHSR